MVQNLRNSNAKYTDKELIELWKRGGKTLGEIPLVSQFKELGIPDRSYYNRRWGSYTKFKQAIGVKGIVANNYKKKQNPKRFFKPQEWISFINNVTNQNHKFWFEFLLHTGMRYNEAKNIRLQDIDLDNRRIEILKAKGGKHKTRTIPISSYLAGRIRFFVKQNKITPTSTLNFPVNKVLNEILKTHCKKIKIVDWYDFSLHNLRKTLEMYGCGLNISSMTLTMMLGHTVTVAEGHYISSIYFNTEEKTLIRSILDNLWL